MTKDLTRALDAVELTYQDVVGIANEMIDPILQPLNEVIDDIRENATNMPAELIRDYIIRVQLRAYELAEPKDKALLKSQLSEALRKEKYANELIGAEGTAGVKDNKATLASSEEIVVEALYELVANLLKTRLDSAYRMVDSLKSILMSKMQEAKFMQLGTSIE